MPTGIKHPTEYLPAVLRDKVRQIASAGGVDSDYAAKAEKWFYLYIESRNASQSTVQAGFENAQISWKGNQLVKKFYPLILEAVQIHRASIEPLAIKVLEEILMEPHMAPLVLRDAEGNERISETLVPDAKIMAVKVKAAAEILDRGMMPRGMALHNPIKDVGAEGRITDWRQLLDAMVEQIGLDAVRMSKIQGVPLLEYREYREYLEGKYGAIKTIEAVVESESGKVN